MNRITLSAALLAGLLLSSCSESTLSGGAGQSSLASAAGYGLGSYTGSGSVNPNGEISEAEIRAALSANRAPLRVPRGSRVLLIQDDSSLPDASLVEAFSPYCEVVPGSGRLNQSGTSPEAVRRGLRHLAAQAGARYIVLVTGVFESTSQNLATQTVSWVPIAGQLIPDERSIVRLKLAVVSIDTASGAWNSLAGPSIVRTRFSNALSRGSSRDLLLDEMRRANWREVAQATFR